MGTGIESGIETVGLYGSIPVDGGGGNQTAPVFHGFERLSGSEDIGADGIADVLLGSPPADGWWLLERIVMKSTSVLDTVAVVYVGEVRDEDTQDIGAGNGAVAEYPRGLIVPGGRVLRVRWTGGTPGARVFVNAQATLWR